MKHEYRDCITVKELIKLLETFPKDMKIGRVGHFGEFNEMDKYYFDKTRAYLVPKNKSWRDGVEIGNRVDVLNISTPDIGEEPD